MISERMQQLAGVPLNENLEQQKKNRRKQLQKEYKYGGKDILLRIAGQYHKSAMYGVGSHMRPKQLMDIIIELEFEHKK
jgi:hypothetical protein